MEGSMVEAVAAANRIVGFDSLGSPTTRWAGCSGRRGSSPSAARRRWRRRRSGGGGRAAAAVDGGAQTDEADGAARRGGGCLGRVAARSAARRPSSRGAMTTQTAPQKSFYERYRAEAEGWRRVRAIYVCA